MPSVLGLQPPTLLQAVLDEVGVALAVIDKEQRFVFTNQAALNLFEVTDILSVEELRRRNYKVHDSQGREILAGQAPILRALAGQEVEPHEVRVTRPDGSFKWLHVAAQSFSVLGLTGVFVVITDETEQVELRKGLERAQRVEEFAILAGGVAHDFNNILSAVSGNVALALSDESIQEVRARLQQMGANLKKGSELVARLMQFSRLQDFEMRPVQVNEVMSSALELVQPLINSRVRLKTELSEGLPAVQGDSSRLEQVLVNLILNALDAMPGGGELALCTELVSSDAVPGNKNDGRKQFVLVSVTDTGVGIPENIRRSIFDPFFTTKPAGAGGLGLSSAQAIVRQHNGQIEVRSAPGAGTTFRIFLPAIETSESHS